MLLVDGLAGFNRQTLDGAVLAGFDEAALPTVYQRSECAAFRKTSDRWGGLSNMAAGFPITVNGVAIRTSEALYQACRFPHRPAVQREIIAQASPIAAKMKSRAYQKDSRLDWDVLRVPMMWWSLRVKLACNLAAFGSLLRATNGLPIVEHSPKDHFWGAVPDTPAAPDTAEDEILVGRNVLGRLLHLLRDVLDRLGVDAAQAVPPLPITDFLLHGEPIRTVGPAR
jgi:type I restriction enzyme, S subunit